MDNLAKINTVAQLKAYFQPIKNPNLVHKSRLTSLDKLALFVTKRVGTMGFFFIILGWTFIWLGWNMFAPSQFKFDPYPAFVLWLFISNLIQIHLMPLIMVGQNIQGKHAELRAEHAFETNQKSEKEIEIILLHLENQQKLLQQIVKKLESLEKK